MPSRAPSPSDFPSHLTLTITPPPSSSSSSSQRTSPPNILLLLHGLGDSHPPFTSLAHSLHLPETTVLTLQAPTPLPFDLPGYHWGDDVVFDNNGSGLDMDAGFDRAKRLILLDVIRDVLLRKCGYRMSEILVWGFGQGGMVGLVCARAVQMQTKEWFGEEGGNGNALSGVIAIGAAYPLSLAGEKTGSGGGGEKAKKNRTPVLLVSGRDSTAVTDSSMRRTKDVFEFVETHTYSRRGDTMPRSRDEMMPVMQFLARRLRSWQGVPEGSVEIS